MYLNLVCLKAYICRDESKHPIFADTGFEHKALYDRLDMVEAKIREFHGNNFKIHRIKNTQYPALQEYIREAKYYPGWQSRFCTRMFKIEPTDDFLEQFKEEGVELMIGLNADEIELRTGNHGNKPFVKYSYPLADNGINRAMCIQILDSVGLNPKFPSYMRRGGCKGCPFKGKAEYKAMIYLSPSEYDDVAQLEQDIQDEKKEFYSINNSSIPQGLVEFKKQQLAQGQLFDAAEQYSIINDATKCGVFCNR